VSIDAPRRVIVFEDNGTGIDPDDLERLLRPFGTDKVGSTNQVGQKGVGLTLVLFSTNQFKIQTRHQNGSAAASVSGARSWVDSGIEDDLLIDYYDASVASIGTRLELRLSDENHPIWQLSFEDLVYLLRTKTALGDTGHIWGEGLEADFEFVHVDASSKRTAREFDCKYLLPTEGLKSEDSISREEYDKWRLEGDRSDAEKRRKLANKIVYQAGKDYKAGRDIRYWSCFVPNRAVWDKLAAIHGLTNGSGEADPTPGELITGYTFSGGLYTSSKGMPTGIFLDLKPRGSAGYVPNFFILIEDPSLSFDIGRKAIQTRQQGMLREIGYTQFREYINSAVKYLSGAIDNPDPIYDREELFEEIKSLPDLSSPDTLFIKRPNGQEATIAAMFFEQLGKGQFGEFKPYISGYRGRYDLYGKLRNRSHVVEFKFNLLGLFKDFTDERKLFDEIDVVVLWDITETDRKALSTRGLSISEVGESTFTAAASRFPQAHYKLSIDGVKTIEVVCLRKVLKPSE
jgi:molecular chaperone HtpG